MVKYWPVLIGGVVAAGYPAWFVWCLHNLSLVAYLYAILSYIAVVGALITWGLARRTE